VIKAVVVLYAVAGAFVRSGVTAWPGSGRFGDENRLAEVGVMVGHGTVMPRFLQATDTERADVGRVLGGSHCASGWLVEGVGR